MPKRHSGEGLVRNPCDLDPSGIHSVGALSEKGW